MASPQTTIILRRNAEDLTIADALSRTPVVPKEHYTLMRSLHNISDSLTTVCLSPSPNEKLYLNGIVLVEFL